MTRLYSTHDKPDWEALPVRFDARGFHVREIRSYGAGYTGPVFAEVRQTGPLSLEQLEHDTKLVCASGNLARALTRLTAAVEVERRAHRVLSDRVLEELAEAKAALKLIEK